MPLTTNVRCVTAIALCVLILSGCSRAVEIPRAQIGAEEYRKPGDYRIRLKGWKEYYARRFSVTDTTVVIEELLKSDDHYKLTKHDMPIVVPLNEIEYVGEMETNRPLTAVVLVGIGSFVGFWVFVAVSGGFGFE